MNLYGKTSELLLKTGVQKNKTIITDLAFTTPFKVLPPFYENSMMNVTILSVSAGLMEGDRQKIKLDIGDNSRVSVSSQTYEKIHKMRKDKAKRETNICVRPGAHLIYQPLPTIPFAKSRFENKTLVNLTDISSIFVYSEILTCGRKYHGERFEFDLFKNYTEIKREDRIIYRDNTLFDPKTMPLEDIGFFEGYSHLGTLIFCGLDNPQKWVDHFYNMFEESNLEIGITKTYYDLVIIKILYNNSDEILKVFDQMIHETGL